MEKTKIAVPITDSRQKDILNKATLINSSKADMLEWRVDYYQHVQDVNKVLETLEKIRAIVRQKEIIFTLRSKGQGGNSQISQEYYMELNTMLANSKNIDYIDIEMDYLDKFDDIKIPIIASYHNFKETPNKNEILSIFKNMESKNAHILKVAVMPNSPKDVLSLLEASYDFYTKTDKLIIAISMGELGKISRISGGLFGSSLTFASLGEESAPGQLTLDDLFRTIEILKSQ